MQLENYNCDSFRFELKCGPLPITSREIYLKYIYFFFCKLAAFSSPFLVPNTRTYFHNKSNVCAYVKYMNFDPCANVFISWTHLYDFLFVFTGVGSGIASTG